MTPNLACQFVMSVSRHSLSSCRLYNFRVRLYNYLLLVFHADLLRDRFEIVEYTLRKSLISMFAILLAEYNYS